MTHATSSPLGRAVASLAALVPLSLGLGTACASEYEEAGPPNTEATATQIQTPSGPIDENGEEALPPTPEPNAPPPPPAASSSGPPPPSTAPPPATPPPDAPVVDPRPVYTPTAPSPDGQWIYTESYGWVWMPYERSYTYVSPAEDEAYAYVYYPRYGWSWIHAPWVIGVGPRPYWGRLGPVRFAWYAHPWFHPRRVYYYRPYYHPHRVYRYRYRR